MSTLAFTINIYDVFFLKENKQFYIAYRSGVAVIAQTAEEASNGGTLQGTPLDAELGLLDAHSTIDLMQVRFEPSCFAYKFYGYDKFI